MLISLFSCREKALIYISILNDRELVLNKDTLSIDKDFSKQISIIKSKSLDNKIVLRINKDVSLLVLNKIKFVLKNNNLKEIEFIR